MRFHVAREGAVMGEFEEQVFRNKVFAGEIRPSDLYWTPGFNDWRPVSEFRVARKTEPITLDTDSAVPPPVRTLRQRSAPAIALICIFVLALIFAVGTMTEKFRGGSSQQARMEAKTAVMRGQIHSGMNTDECVALLGEPTRIERISGSKNEDWTYESPGGRVTLQFENGVLRRANSD